MRLRLRDSGSESSTFIPLSALRLGNFMGPKFKFTDCFFPLLYNLTVKHSGFFLLIYFTFQLQNFLFASF